MKVLQCLFVWSLLFSQCGGIDQTKSVIPPNVLKCWSYLVGHWDLEGQVGSSKVSGTAQFEWAEGKHCYIGRQVWQIGENRERIYLTLIGGWDATKKHTVEQGFDSSGSAATVRYDSPNESNDTFEGRIDGTGGQVPAWSGAVTLDRSGENEFRLTTTIDGKVVHSLKYVRKD